MSALASLGDGKRLVVLVGPGGVGKTTLAAALAIDAASRGRPVALLTIDPARRLAGALGLDRLGDALAPVPGAPGLEAAMLDTRASFDALVGRIARSDSERARILDNRLYEAFSRTLARPHAYVAMERLHELLVEGPDERLVVLDTPPTHNALDILDAPGRLVRFLDTGVADALVSDASGPDDGVRAWTRRSGRALVRALLGRVLGEALVDDLAGFFEVFFHLRHGFAARAASTQAHLRAPSTAFVLVTAPDPCHLGDAAALAEGLYERGVTLDALLANRVHRITSDVTTTTGGVHTVSPEPTDEAAVVLAAARAYRDRIVIDDARRRAAAASFAADHQARQFLAFPWRDEGPTDIEALRNLAEAALPAPSTWQK